MSDWSKVTRPIPVPNEWTKPFWESAKKNVLSLQRCQACKHFQHPLSDVTKLLAHDDLFEPREQVRYSGAITSAEGFKAKLAAWKAAWYVPTLTPEICEWAPELNKSGVLRHGTTRDVLVHNGPKQK